MRPTVVGKAKGFLGFSLLPSRGSWAWGPLTVAPRRGMAVSSYKTLNQLGQDQGQQPSPLSLDLEVESRSVSNMGCAVREALKGQK